MDNLALSRGCSVNEYGKRLLAWLSFMAALPCSAEPLLTGDPLFAEDSTINVTLTAPLSTIIRERPTEGYIPGTFEYEDAEGKTQTLDVGLRTRGNFRLRTCDFPPLRVNFKKSAVHGTLFDGQNKLKMVAHCDNQARYEQYVLREYMAYRVLNLLTDKSFRVRLMQVRYVDSDGRRKDQVRYAFFIEHKKRLAKRLGVPIYAVEDGELNEMDGEHLNLTSIFQLFIANTDFSPIAGPPDSNCCHNYVLFRDKEGGPVTAIPYDFDQSGFVDAPYAEPNPRMKIRSVTQRLYRGRCVFNEQVGASIDAFSTMRDPIYEIVENQPGATERVRKTLARFIDKFYAVVDDPKRVQRDIINKCI
jgi:hypothetical protein